MTGVEVDAAHSKALTRGALLTWTGTSSTGILEITKSKRHLPIDLVHSSASREWAETSVGIMLRPAAERLRLPVGEPTVLIPDAGDDWVNRAREVAVSRGYDPREITVWHSPRGVAPPAALIAGTALLAIVLAMISVGLARAQLTRLRSYFAQLRLIGVPRWWITRVVLWRMTATSTVALALGFLVSATPIVAIARHVDDMRMIVPIPEVAGLVSAFVGGQLLALVVSRRVIARTEDVHRRW